MGEVLKQFRKRDGGYTYVTTDLAESLDSAMEGSLAHAVGV